MKNLFKYTLVLLAAAGIMASCAKEVEDVYTKGEADVEGCYGVFFPKQDAAGDHVVDPADPTKITITVSRKETKGDIEVPYTLTATAVVGDEVKDASSIFKGGVIAFTDGQSETTLDITYPDSEIGVSYSCKLEIETGKYASIYSTSSPSLSFGITRVKWNDKGIGLMREDLLTGVMGSYCNANAVLEVRFWERDDIPGMYRIQGAYSHESLTKFVKPDYLGEEEGAPNDAYFVLDASNPEKVWIPYTCTQWQFYSNGVFYIGSIVPENEAICADFKGYTSTANYGTVDSATGLITFPYRSQAYGFSADEWYGRGNTSNGVGMLYFAPPGVTPVDYSIKLQSDFSEEGVAPIYVTVGLDVVSIKYAVFEGTLNKAQAANKVAAIVDGSEESTEFSDFTAGLINKTATLGVSPEETGEYTFVAVTYDKKGNAQNDAYTAFTFVSGDDEVPVVLTCGLEVTGKYASQGYTTENSLEFYIYGEDIVSAKIAVFKKLDVISKGEKACIEALLKETAVKAEVLEKINGDGYVDIVTGLIPGTEFYLFVWASNGYQEDVFVAGPAQTTGDPLPIYQTFTDNDYDEKYKLADASEWVGTWNMYGIDPDDKAYTGMRAFLGKATISMSETPSDGPDNYGFYDEYVYINGMFGNTSWIKNYVPTWDDTFEMDVYAGCMYAFQNTLVNDALGDCQVEFYSKGQGTWGWDYVKNYWAYFIPVLDGYYAFVDNKYGASYNFCGLGIYSENAGGWLARVYDQLLVDPAKDDNGIAPAAIAAKTEVAKAKMNKFVDEALNSGLSGKHAMRHAIDEYMKDYNNCIENSFNPAGMIIEHEAKVVKATVRPIDKVQPIEAAPAGQRVVPARSR